MQQADKDVANSRRVAFIPCIQTLIPHLGENFRSSRKMLASERMIEDRKSPHGGGK